MASRNSGSIKGSYIVSTISITLVLFLIGIMAFLMLNAREISNYVKENIGFSVVIKDHVKSVDVKMFQKMLETEDFAKTTNFIDKEEAAKDFKKQVGDDFVSFLGFNPLLASIDIKLNAKYANQDSIAMIEKKLKAYEVVHEVNYQKSLVSVVNNNVKKISMVLTAISALMLLISFALIRNTIHLSIYSQRFLINTMQLVGATSSFIRKPFMGTSVLLGILAALLANAALMGSLYFADKHVHEVVNVLDHRIMAVLFAVVVLFGVVITLCCTFFAVNRYLRKDISELYA